jgi:hypothetical protein
MRGAVAISGNVDVASLKRALIHACCSSLPVGVSGLCTTKIKQLVSTYRQRVWDNQGPGV